MGLFDRPPEVVTDAKLLPKILEIIERATQELVLISPYVDPGRNVVNEITKAAARAKVTLLFREDKLDEYRQQGWYRQFAEAGIELGVIPRLHSKIYLNEQYAMVGSANLTHDSWMNSHELALVFKRRTAVGAKVDAYVGELVRMASPLERRSAEASGRASAEVGFCIRCAGAIPLDPKRPYCREDWASWAPDGTASLKETFCHQCGQRAAASKARPLCSRCFGS